MSPDSDRTGRGVGRRRFLAALGSATALGLAGCQGVTSQSFEAKPVSLPQESMESLGLGEVARDSLTLQGEVLGGNVDVTITSHAAVYSRALGMGGR